MLVRSASSRRRRASRSTASSPQRSNAPVRNNKSRTTLAAGTTLETSELLEQGRRSRRSSVAAGTGSGSVPLLVCNRSPRNSIAVPLGSEGNLLVSNNGLKRSSRSGISTSDATKSTHPEIFGSESGGGSFSEGFSESFLLADNGNRSRSARNSFSVPEIDNYEGSRSARGSFAIAESSADLLLPPQGTRSARASFSCPSSDIHTSAHGSRSARASFSVPSDNLEPLLAINKVYRDRTPRGSLIPPEACLSPRNSLVSDNIRSPRGSILPEISSFRSSRESRGSIVLENTNRTGKTNKNLEVNVSPREIIITEYNTSTKGCLEQERSKTRRGSSGTEDMPLRSPRTSPRGSVPDAAYSSRDNAIVSNLQISPRGSLDSSSPGSSKGMGKVTIGSYRLATRGGYQMNNIGIESRRASSSVSQVSVDDRRQLCEHTRLNVETGEGLQIYGSVAYQLKDANMEASGTCDFVHRALRVVFKTISMTVLLVCLTTVPIVMLIMGVNYLRDCPREPHLPVYMVVGGSFATIKMIWIIWRQVKSRRYERPNNVQLQPPSNYEDTLLTASAGSRGASFALALFLIVWFILGNYWTLHIYLPDFEPELYDPNKWCSKTLYIFSLVHLGIVHFFIVSILVLVIVFMCCHTLSCPMVMRYK
ncbi:hypothetical protein RUM44_013070 [Polyplax serrata]|uniref:Uncharacterized protein n=1 Tax=Polyplax serrata TaxID=468196 RepID=A0ABR1BGS6_POLSC